jgi:hypothetical protein
MSESQHAIRLAPRGDAGAIGRTRRIIGLTAARELNVETVVLKRKSTGWLSAQQAYGDMLDPFRDDDQRY